MQRGISLESAICRCTSTRILENIQAVLAALSGEMGDILSLTQHTADIAAFMTSGDVCARYFKEFYVATTTVKVSALYHHDILVEITAIA